MLSIILLLQEAVAALHGLAVTAVAAILEVAVAAIALLKQAEVAVVVRDITHLHWQLLLLYILGVRLRQEILVILEEEPQEIQQRQVRFIYPKPNADTLITQTYKYNRITLTRI
jgi:hypothetical protein